MGNLGQGELPDQEAIHGMEIQEVRGPHGPLDEEGNPLLTIVLENGLEADIRVESVRTQALQQGIKNQSPENNG